MNESTDLHEVTGADVPNSKPTIAKDLHELAASGTKGTGSQLPYYKVIQAAFGKYDISQVKAYINSQVTRALGAEAYTCGNEIVFNKYPSLFVAAHEAAHVIQQRANILLKNGCGEAGDLYEQHANQVAQAVMENRSAEQILDELPGIPAVQASAKTPLLQLFDARDPQPLANGVPLDNTAYPGHSLAIAANMYGCASNNVIKTAGERLNSTKSLPGSPADYNQFKNKWKTINLGQPAVKLKGGLVKDKNMDRASIRMHAINHHLDNTAGAAGTQKNAGNIFLGSNASNQAHSNQIEEHIVEALAPGVNRNALKPLTSQNNLYETEIGNGRETQLKTFGTTAVFWATPALATGLGKNVTLNVAPRPVDNRAIKHVNIRTAVLHEDDDTIGISFVNKTLAKGVAKGDDKYGYAILIENNTPQQHYPHTWLEYEVQANYPANFAALPQYIRDNHAGAETWVNNSLAGNRKTAKEKVLNNFKTHADQIFPTTFTCTANYYTASYRPGNRYHKQSTNQTLSAHL
jgi:hypothetical protein